MLAPCTNGWIMEDIVSLHLYDLYEVIMASIYMTYGTYVTYDLMFVSHKPGDMLLGTGFSTSAVNR